MKRLLLFCSLICLTLSLNASQYHSQNTRPVYTLEQRQQHKRYARTIGTITATSYIGFLVCRPNNNWAINTAVASFLISEACLVTYLIANKDIREKNYADSDQVRSHYREE